MWCCIASMCGLTLKSSEQPIRAFFTFGIQRLVKEFSRSRTMKKIINFSIFFFFLLVTSTLTWRFVPEHRTVRNSRRINIVLAFVRGRLMRLRIRSLASLRSTTTCWWATKPRAARTWACWAASTVRWRAQKSTRRLRRERVFVPKCHRQRRRRKPHDPSSCITRRAFGKLNFELRSRRMVQWNSFSIENFISTSKYVNFWRALERGLFALSNVFWMRNFSNRQSFLS